METWFLFCFSCLVAPSCTCHAGYFLQRINALNWFRQDEDNFVIVIVLHYFKCLSTILLLVFLSVFFSLFFKQILFAMVLPFLFLKIHLFFCFIFNHQAFLVIVLHLFYRLLLGHYLKIIPCCNPAWYLLPLQMEPVNNVVLKLQGAKLRLS